MFVNEHEFFVSKHSQNDKAIGLVAPSMVCGQIWKHLFRTRGWPNLVKMAGSHWYRGWMMAYITYSFTRMAVKGS